MPRHVRQQAPRDVPWPGQLATPAVSGDAATRQRGGGAAARPRHQRCPSRLPRAPPRALSAGICALVAQRSHTDGRCVPRGARRHWLREQARGVASPKKNGCDKRVSSLRRISCCADESRFYTDVEIRRATARLCSAAFIGDAVSLCADASIAQLAEHALRKRMVVGSIPTGG